MEILYELEKLTHLGIERAEILDFYNGLAEGYKLKDRNIFIFRSIEIMEFPFMIYFREDGMQGLFHVSWELLCDEDARQYIIEEVEDMKNTIRNREK